MNSEKIRDAIPFYISCLALHVISVSMWFFSAMQYSELWGVGLVAYTLGLRHAFDADHIAAIDNTVRKLINQGKKSSGVGFFFSLGHSTVVLIIATLIAFSMSWIEGKLPILSSVGGKIGSLVSGTFLLIIAAVNTLILISLLRRLRQRQSLEITNDELSNMMAQGFLTRWLSPVFKLVSRARQMYFVGFLFGLGFDTASEIALIALSIGTAKASVPVSSVLSLPLLFASGMSLLDTTDSVMMSRAYQWAFSEPLKKAYYNVVVTMISVIAAVLIGVVEIIQTFPNTFSELSWLQNLDLGNFGWGLFVILCGTWLLCYVVTRVKAKV